MLRWVFERIRTEKDSVAEQPTEGPGDWVTSIYGSFWNKDDPHPEG